MTPLDDLRAWIGRTEERDRHDHRRAARRPRRDARPRRRSARRRQRPSRRSGTGSTSCRCSAKASSAPTAIRAAAASCRRSRCRAACGRAAGSASSGRSRVGEVATRTSRIADVTAKDARSGPLVFVTVRHGSRRRPESPLERGPRHRLPRPGRARRGRGGAAAAPRDELFAREIAARRRAAVSLFGADLQRPPHPLRPPLRHRGRGLSGADRARPADRDAAARPAAPRAPGRRVSCASSSRR